MTDRASWRLAPGDGVAGDRRLVHRLGGGKRTEVVLATDPRAGEVVVKLLRPGASAAAARAVRAEAELLARLDHPLFPRLVELRERDGEPLALVLERVPGRRLSTALRRDGPLSAGRAAELAASLADGLASLAGVGYVHLDVKPSNTLVGERFRLVDLGIARSLADARAVRGTVGSHRFQSPEQHDPHGSDGLTPAADVWGVGVTVATALRGRSPFGPLRDEQDRRRRLTPDDVSGFALPVGVPPALEQLVRTAMAWEPAARPAAAELAARAGEVARRLG